LSMADRAMRRIDLSTTFGRGRWMSTAGEECTREHGNRENTMNPVSSEHCVHRLSKPNTDTSLSPPM
jgi:hypothetical protein